MSRKVTLADGRTKEFPNGTPDSEIQAWVKGEMGIKPSAEPRGLAPGGDSREALLAVGSGAIAEPISGYAGILGGLAGMVPGGESPIEKAARYQAGTQEALTYKPRTQVGADAAETIGRGAEALTKGVRTPIAGLAGVAQLPFSGVEGASETIRRTREAGIGPTAANYAEELGAPPSVSTALHTGPTALATVAGTRFPKVAPKTNPSVATPGGSQVSVGRPSLDRPVDMTPPDPLSGVARPDGEISLGARPDKAPPANTIVEDLSKQKTERLAQAVVPDVEVIDAAQRLGVDLNVEHYSTNSAFQGVARALKSKGDSQLLVGERAALAALADEADALVVRMNGSLDSGSLSASIVTESMTTIKKLGTEAGDLYEQVNSALPPRTRVDTAGISEFIQGRIDDFGGDLSQLSKAELKILKMIKNGKDGSVTYATLDNVRKDIGEALGQGTGPFKNNSRRVLGEVYENLSDTQQGVTDAFGVGDIYTEARGLVARRKGLEDQATTLCGKDAAGSLVPKIRASARGLPIGDLTAFNKLLDALPDARRGEVAATVLGELFAGGSRQGGQLGTGFAQTWRNLNRKTHARDALLRELPPEAAQRFQDIGRVMDAIVRSNSKAMANPSGTTAGILRALEDGTLATKLYGTGKAIAMEAAQSTPGVGTVLRMSKRVDNSPTGGRVGRADTFLTSQVFKDAVSVALEGDLAKANGIIENSPVFKNWINTVPEQTARNIGAVGFISWLASEEE